MYTRIYGSDLNDILIEANYHTLFKDPSEPIVERTFSIDISLGKGNFKGIAFQGVHIFYSELKLLNDTKLNFIDDRECIEMHFALEGLQVTHSDSYENTIRFTSGYHNVFYADGFRCISEWSSRTPLKTFEVAMTADFYKKYLPENHYLFRTFKKSIINKKSAVLLNQNYPITQQMYEVISDILQSDRQGYFKSIFLEYKVISLLLLQLEQIHFLESNDFSKKMKKRDVEKIHAVKEFLDKNINKIETLTELAKKVGTNEYTLKKGFKELFGTSVFQYWKSHRLNVARQMLMDEGLSVKEVSQIIGYKYSQHFSTDFKKEFGLVPSKFIQSG